MADEYADLLAHEVDAAYGMVGADTEDGTVPAVRLLFHHGHDLERTRHSERFMAPEGLPGLIGQLRALQLHLEAEGAAEEIHRGVDAGPGRFKDYARALSDAEPGLMDLPLTSFALGAMAAVLDEAAAPSPGEDRDMFGELADMLEDLLHGPMGDEVRRVAERFGQISPGEAADAVAEPADVHPDCTCPNRRRGGAFDHSDECPVHGLLR